MCVFVISMDGGLDSFEAPILPHVHDTTPPRPTACAKCVVGRCQISLSNFVKNPVTLELYCKTHYMAKFRVEGKYLGADEYARN